MKLIFRILWISLFISMAVLLFSSCDIYKKSSKEKKDVDFTEQISTKTTRIGDTVRYEVPNVTMKDTTIYTYNKQGTTLKTVYLNGQVNQVECQTSAIELLINENRRLQDNSKEKDSEKKEEVNTTWILYGFMMIGFVVSLALTLMFFYIKSQTGAITGVLERFAK